MNQLRVGDLVQWCSTTKQDYFNYNESNLGIFLRNVERFDHWVLAEVLDRNGQVKIVMLQNGVNPL